MTKITSNSVKPHDLSSMEVIEGLKESDHFLIDEIASQLYLNILRATNLENEPSEQRGKILERLKWVLHNQVEVLGGLYKCDELIARLVSEDVNIRTVLRDFTFQLDTLTLHLMTLFDESEYSTWNLLYHLDPYYLSLSKNRTLSVLRDLVREPSYEMVGKTSSSYSFVEKLAGNGLYAEAAHDSLESLLYWSQRYSRLIRSFYDASSETVIAIYAFYYIESTAAHLLGASLSTRLLFNLNDRLSRSDDQQA